MRLSRGQQPPRHLEQHPVVSKKEKKKHRGVNQIVKRLVRSEPLAKILSLRAQPLDLFWRERLKFQAAPVGLRQFHFLGMQPHVTQPSIRLGRPPMAWLILAGSETRKTTEERSPLFLSTSLLMVLAKSRRVL